MFRVFVPVLLLPLAVLLPLPAQPAPEVFLAKTVILKKGTPLAESLAQMEKQTGIKLRDGRTNKSEVELRDAHDKTPFWQTLDALASNAKARVNLYAGDGVLELVDHARPATPVSYHQAFRTTLHRISLNDDLEGSKSCVIHLTTTWEPRLYPLLMDVGSSSITFAPDAVKKQASHSQPGKGTVQVEGKLAMEHEVRVPAPARSSPAIQELKGNLTFTVPTKYLTFDFAKLPPAKPIEEVSEGVKVTLKQLATDSTRWVATIVIDNPPDTPKFESYQSWLVHNRAVLKNDKHTWNASGADELVVKMTAQQAIVEYHFLLKQCPTPKPLPANWTLHYRTPGRMVELQVPYRFEKVPLP